MVYLWALTAPEEAATMRNTKEHRNERAPNREAADRPGLAPRGSVAPNHPSEAEKPRRSGARHRLPATGRASPRRAA